MIEIWKRINLALAALFPKGIDLGKIWLVGAFLAMVISWGSNKSVVLAIFHGLISWVYVFYYALSN